MAQAKLELETFQSTLAYKILQAEQTQTILTSAQTFSAMIPQDVQSFFLREQGFGHMANQFTELNRIGSLIQSLSERQREIKHTNDNA